MILGKLTRWQYIRWKLGLNFYTIDSNDRNIAFFNDQYPMELQTAKNNLGNKPDPKEWDSFDFCSFNGYLFHLGSFHVDVVARLMYNKECKDHFKKIDETLKRITENETN